MIGGGDWASDRLIPDFLRALDAGATLKIRSPLSTRPWQHVLEPLSGYLTLAERLYTEGMSFAEGWNFGPTDEDARPVSWLVERMAEMREDVSWEYDETPQPHEANYLKLDSSKAHLRLGWQPLEIANGLAKNTDMARSLANKTGYACCHPGTNDRVSNYRSRG